MCLLVAHSLCWIFWRDASHILELTEKTGSLHIGGLSDVSNKEHI